MQQCVFTDSPQQQNQTTQEQIDKVQHARVLAAKLEDVSSIPRAHMVEVASKGCPTSTNKPYMA